MKPEEMIAIGFEQLDSFLKETEIVRAIDSFSDAFETLAASKRAEKEMKEILEDAPSVP